MSKRSPYAILTAALALPAVLVAAPWTAGAVPSQEPHLKDSDLRKLGESLKDYIEAREENKGVGDAEADIKDEMDKLRKKLSKAGGSEDILASPADLGLAMWLSFDYQRQRVTKGKVSKEEYTEGFFTKDEPLEYAVWAPAKYAARTGPYAVILTIPDEGETPTDHLIEKWIDADIRDNVILAAPAMPEDRGEWGGRPGVARVIVLMRAIYELYAVDFDRIYIAGRGLGVETAVSIAEQFPDRFAGVIGRTGDVGDTAAENFQNLPTYFAGGGAKATAFSEAIGTLGYQNCTIEAEGSEKDIWNWIQSHSRMAYPEKVTLVPGKPFPKRAYWLEVPPTDGSVQGRISASIDRATNTITVEGEGMTEFILHFNDVLLDMDKPIKVVANGIVSEDAIPRSRNVLLANIFNSICDPGRMFVASKLYHLPARAKDGGGE